MVCNWLILFKKVDLFKNEILNECYYFFLYQFLQNFIRKFSTNINYLHYH